MESEKALLVQERHINRNRPEADDAELVRSFRGGNESAFSAIVTRYQNRLFQVARSILGDDDDARDLSQEAFVKAYFHLKTFREESSLYTWLYRILYNLCISHLRRKKIISFFSFDHYDEQLEFESDEPNPGEVCERRELMDAIMGAVETLPLRQRTVFTLRQMEGLTHGEIAKIMGITEGAVKASYFHAVRKLQSLLKPYGDAL